MSVTLKDPRIEITPDVRILVRSDGKSVIFDRRLPLGTNAGVFDHVDEATKIAKAKYATDVKPKGPAKMAATDEELFAAMKRAMAKGFAKHEPAYTAEELRALEAA